MVPSAPIRKCPAPRAKKSPRKKCNPHSLSSGPSLKRQAMHRQIHAYEQMHKLASLRRPCPHEDRAHWCQIFQTFVGHPRKTLIHRFPLSNHRPPSALCPLPSAFCLLLSHSSLITHRSSFFRPLPLRVSVSPWFNPPHNCHPYFSFHLFRSQNKKPPAFS